MLVSKASDRANCAQLTLVRACLAFSGEEAPPILKKCSVFSLEQIWKNTRIIQPFTSAHCVIGWRRLDPFDSTAEIHKLIVRRQPALFDMDVDLCPRSESCNVFQVEL